MTLILSELPERVILQAMLKSDGQLGDLELAVMMVLWKSKEPLVVSDVVLALNNSRAYTTVMTTLSRLYKKGYLDRQREGRSYKYSARLTQATVLQRMWGRVADVLTGGDIVELIPHLLGQERQLSARERRSLQKIAKGILDRDS